MKGANNRLQPTANLARSQAAVMVLRVAAKGAELSVLPSAPTDLKVVAKTEGRVVSMVAPGSYVGNDDTPRVEGKALPLRPVALYDTVSGATSKVTESATNAAGNFYADLTLKLAEGAHSLTAKVTNTVGQVSPASTPVTYVLDTVAPTGTVTAPVVPGGGPDAAVNT